MGTTKRLLLSALAIPSVILTLWGCGVLGAGEKSEAPSDLNAPAETVAPAYPVRVQVAALRPLQYELHALGSVEAQDVYRLEARVAGIVTGLSFNEGDRVLTGQVLGEISSEAYGLAVRKQEALYRQAEANLADTRRRRAHEAERARIRLAEAQAQLERRQSVQSAGAVSAEELATYQAKRDLAAVEVKDATAAAETEIQVLQAQHAAQGIQLQQALDALRDSSLIAPIEGIVEQRRVTNGTHVQAGTPLAVMVDRRTLRLRFSLAEKDAAAVQAGAQVRFEVPAHPGRQFEAHVYHVGEQLEEHSRVIVCWARVTDDAAALKPGYFASVRIAAGAGAAALVIPATAVLPTEKGAMGFVVKEGRAEQRVLLAGQTVNAAEIEILEGIEPGELVVIEGANALRQGVPVRVLPAQPQTAPVSFVPEAMQ